MGACGVLRFLVMYCFFVFFKQKTAYEMRISDWSSDVCSSDLNGDRRQALPVVPRSAPLRHGTACRFRARLRAPGGLRVWPWQHPRRDTVPTRTRSRGVLSVGLLLLILCSMATVMQIGRAHV